MCAVKNSEFFESIIYKIKQFTSSLVIDTIFFNFAKLSCDVSDVNVQYYDESTIPVGGKSKRSARPPILNIIEL
jgi:hypothetical protein